MVRVYEKEGSIERNRTCIIKNLHRFLTRFQYGYKVANYPTITFISRVTQSELHTSPP